MGAGSNSSQGNPDIVSVFPGRPPYVVQVRLPTAKAQDGSMQTTPINPRFTDGREAAWRPAIDPAVIPARASAADPSRLGAGR